MPEKKLIDCTLGEIMSNTKMSKDVIMLLVDAIAQECYTKGLQSGFAKGKAYGEAHARPDMKLINEGIEE